MQILRRYQCVLPLVAGLCLTAFWALNALPTFGPSGVWTSTANLSQARTGAAAAVLDDGDILVTGGESSSTVLSSVERYGSGGVFSSAPAMTYPRRGHTITKLADGRLLVVGGITTGGAPTSTVELYSPVTNSWTVAGGMPAARSGHTATLLDDGRVLIAGGSDGAATLASMVIFDPASGTYTNAPAMSTPRQGHAATVVARDGRVVIAGGSNGAAALASIDIYDPETNSLTPGPSMTVPRAGLSATGLLNGRVLLAGGGSATTEILNPNTGSISAGPTMSAARADHLALLLPGNNTVLVAGGSASAAGAEIFVPWQNQFRGFGTLSSARTGVAGVASKLDAIAQVAGGTDANGVSSTVDVVRFPTVVTDKEDYSPGTTVVVTGSGFEPGETVNLTLQEEPYLDTHGPYSAVADASGSFTNTDFVPDEHDVGIRFYLAATGEGSGLTAGATFTDARNWVLTFAGTGTGSVKITPSTGTVNAPVGCGGTGAAAATQTVTSTCTPNITTSDSDATVTLLAAAAGGSTFAGWSAPNNLSSSTCTGTTNSCSAVIGSNGALTVTFNAPVATSLAVSSATAVYGGSAALSATLTQTTGGAPVSGQTINFTLNGTSVGSAVTNASGVASIAAASLSGINAGTYTSPPPAGVRASFAGGGGFSSSNGSNTLTVTPAPLTVTADAKSKVYGNPDPALTYQLTSGALIGSDSFSGALTRAAGETVAGGPYAISQGTLTAGANYTITFVGANLTITARPITVTADAKSKVYGDPDPALTYQITSGSLAFSDTFSGALTRTAGETVAGGPYAILQGTLALNSNYSLTYVGANLTITPRPVTVTADAKSKIYGDADPALTYQITAGSLAFSDTFSGVLTRAPGETVAGGPYAIQQGTLALNANYTLTYIGANLTINVRPITVTADAKSKVYGDADPALTYQLTSGSLVFSDAFSGALTRAPGETVAGGPYAIHQGTLTAGDNYAITFVGANLTITPRPVTVTADAKSKVYGNPDPALTYQITSGSLAFSDTFSGALTRAAGESVAGGPYAIQQGTLSLGGNYTLTFVGANLTITVRPITVTADAKTKVYGAADPALTYQITSGSLAFSDAFSGALTRAPGETVAGGPYAILQGTLALNPNYAVTFVGANLTITVRPITVTADPKSKVYGDADPALTYQITSGSLAFSDAFSGALTRAPGETVAGGPYAILQGTLALNANYALTYVGASLTITTRPLTVTADAKSKVYGDADPALTYQLTSGSLIGGDMFSGALTRAAGENVAGSPYAILQGTLTAGGNYAITFVGANLTITVRPITVTADGKTKVYGNPDPALTYQISSGSLAFSDAFSGALTRAPGETVAGGPYAILQGTLSLGGNYALTFVGANLTITLRPITVTADAKSKVYGDSDPALTYQITSGSLAFSDTFSGALTRAPGETVAGGPYAISQGSLVLNPNYTLTFFGANLMITLRPITVTADAKSKMYGDADPALTYQITSGSLAFSDTFSGALTRAPGENVTGSPYAILQGTLALNANYALTYVGASLTITPLPLTVTADGKSKVYGNSDPALTYQLTSGSLIGGDMFSGALTRAAGENVAGSPYAILQGTLTAGGNYAITFVGANLTITVRPITVTADSKSKVYGDPDPVLTYQITSGSLAFSDAFSGALTRVAGETVAGSPYAIQKGTLALNDNYALTFFGANLTITQASQTITFAQPSSPVTVGNSFLVSPTASSGLVVTISTSGVCSNVGYSVTITSGVGTCMITASQAGDSNYFPAANVTRNVAANAPPTISVNSASVTVNEGSLASNSGTFGDANGDAVILSASVGTVVPGAGTWTWSYTPPDGVVPPAVQTITVSANDGYVVSMVTFNLTVNNVMPTILSAAANPSVISMSGSSMLTVTFSDPGVNDNPTCGQFTWLKDGAAEVPPVVANPTNTAGMCTTSRSFPSVGVYEAKVTVTDKDGGSAVASILVPVYDPSLGFVTGGGWIDSPEGAYAPDPTLTGKANFGFVSKYKKGQSTPDGQTQFQFQAGDVNFHSTSYAWLVVNQSKAQFKGRGTINGQGDYNFLLTAIDGDQLAKTAPDYKIDKFRIKIMNRNPDGSDGSTIYDNQMLQPDTGDSATVLGGGSIQIQSK